MPLQQHAAPLVPATAVLCHHKAFEVALHSSSKLHASWCHQWRLWPFWVVARGLLVTAKGHTFVNECKSDIHYTCSLSPQGISDIGNRFQEYC